MKNLLTVTLLVLCIAFANAQSNDSILIGNRVTIFSKVLNENRRIWIYNPSLTSNDNTSNKKYPVIYLLDGDAHFLSTVGIVQQLSQANGNGVLPEMIIVGIENTNRLRDLTPNPELGKEHPFISFLSNELIPFIDKNYNTAPYKVLIGHSLGGLTAIDLLTNKPELFNAYIAIDPSMWYKDETFLNHTIVQFPKMQLAGRRLFIGTANTMPKGITLATLKTNHSTETQHIRSILKLDHFLKTNQNGLLYAQKYYENENHNTVPLISEYDGLRFVFDYYFLNATEKDFTDTTNAIALKLFSHYNNVSKHMGYKTAAPESFVNYLAYDALAKKQFIKAGALFNLNIENYPSSSNVYDAYGDFFAAKKDTANAVTYYNKALHLKNDEKTQAKLKAFEKHESFALTLNDLQKYAGVYTLEMYKLDITLEIRNGKLFSKVPGQPDSELMPISKDLFTVKDKEGYTITFKTEDNKVLEFVSVQPNGTFKAIKKAN